MAQSRYRRHQGTYTIVLLGQKDQLREAMVSSITGSAPNVLVLSDCVIAETSTVRVVSPPDIFDTNNKYVDQHIIDCMALSLPGPHIFMLAIDQDNAQENFVAQTKTLQTFFGNMAQNLVTVLTDTESFQLHFSHTCNLKEQVMKFQTIATENLATACKEWCDKCEPFTYSFNNYSEAVLVRRRDDLLRRNYSPVGDETATAVVPYPNSIPHPPAAPASKPESSLSRRQFNIILMGLTGTGKSASANTILSAAKSKSKFESYSNSEPITLECQCARVELFGTELTVVDTPDFFHENINSQEQLEECKKYLVPGHYAVLLVVKVNRFTDEERDILEKLEGKLGMSIRENTILLLTCGEELDGKLNSFIKQNPELDKVASQCCCRFHLFKNKKNKPEQVQKLIKKFPLFHNFFPKVDVATWFKELARQLAEDF